MYFKKTKKGTFNPTNKQKYIGNTLPIYRSSWELKAFITLDRNPKILRWGSENFIIPYIDTTRNNETHKYVIDLFFEIADCTKNGVPIKWLLEIKPQNQSEFKKYTKRKNLLKAMEETEIVARNHCKWNSAISFCKSKGWHFRGIY